MDRRSFIKLTAISGTSAALASCGSPENTLIRFVPDEDIVPGQAVWKPSVCPSCASGCGLTVRVMDAEADVVRGGQAGIVQILAAKKLEGSPMYPVNRGALCARGQAAIQVTYHPDRITQPLKRSGDRGSGQYAAISWDEAIQELVARLDTLTDAGTQKALACLTNSRGHRAALLDMFLSRFGAPGAVNFEMFGDEVLRRANALSFGRDQLPTYDLANARHVIAFGADFLGTWNSPVSNAQGYGHMRQGRRGRRGSFDFLHVENFAVKIGHLLRVGRVQGDVTNRHRPRRIGDIEGTPRNSDCVAVRILKLMVDAGERVHLANVAVRDADLGELFAHRFDSNGVEAEMTKTAFLRVRFRDHS